MEEGIIRQALPEDRFELSEYWYDQMAILKQADPSVRLHPQAAEQWQRAFERWQNVDQALIFVCEIERAPKGCIVGLIRENQVGLLPQQIGVVESLVLDPHLPRQQRGVAAQLWNALADAFRRQGIELVEVRSTKQALVSHAFWQSQPRTRTTAEMKQIWL